MDFVVFGLAGLTLLVSLSCIAIFHLSLSLNAKQEIADEHRRQLANRYFEDLRRELGDDT